MDLDAEIEYDCEASDNETSHFSDNENDEIENAESENPKKRKLSKSAEKKKAKRSKKDRTDINYKASTMKFNLFNSEIENLLTDMKVKAKYLNTFKEWFEKFQAFLVNMKEFEDIRLSELVKHKKTSSKKFYKNLVNKYECNFETDCDTWIKCLRPQGCFTSGFFPLDCLVGPELSVDVNLIIPKKCFLTKDYLNNVWIIKCHYYLTYIYTQLLKSDLCGSITFNCKKEVLTFTLKESSKVLVKINVVPEEDSFKYARFEPDKNNIKKSLCASFGEVDEALKDHPTPYFNTLAMRKLTLQPNCGFMKQKLAGMSVVLEGIKLLTIWLKNRFLFGRYGFTEDLLTHTIVHLISTKKITNLTNVYQVLRAFWQYISTSDWQKEPVSIGEVSADKLALFCKNFDIVFLDKSCSYNIAAFLLPNIYRKIKSEAELAVEYLDNPDMDPFWPLFMMKMEPQLQYDAIIRLEDKDEFENVYRSIEQDDSFKMMACFRSLVTKHILTCLSRGLTKRVVHIVPLFDDECRENERFTTLFFGVNLEEYEAFNIIEKGPAGNAPEAVEFRNFWGKKSELRKFADSTIKEAVYFPVKTIQEKRSIFKKIVEFVVQEKLQIEQCKVICNEVEDVLVLKNYTAPFHVGTCEEASLSVMNTLVDLSKLLRSFTLPLEVTGVQGISDTFCYANAFPPVPKNYKSDKLTTVKDNNVILKNELSNAPLHVEPIDCVIQLNLNSKWPDDIEAIRRVKCAFYLEMAKLLQKYNILSNCNMEFITVLYRGLVFRFRLFHTKEVTILRQYTKPDGMVAYKDTEESLNLVKNLDILPKVVSALNGVHSQHPSYGPSTCLIKRWLRAQLLDDVSLPDVVINLLNAALYINNAPYCKAVLPQVAFMRFLKHYGEFDFNVQSVVVNFNNELSKDEIAGFESKFRKNRIDFPAMYIIAHDDEGNSIYTKNCTREIVRRFSVLCKSAYQAISDGIWKNSFDFKDLFIPNTEGYDILINLKAPFNAKRYQTFNFESPEDKRFKLSKFQENSDDKIPIVDFNPVQLYLEELRKNYGEFVFFFHDSFGGNVIGGLWRPTALKTKDFKISFLNGTELVKDKLVLNKQAIIEDFSMAIGQGLVMSIDFVN